jgi:hypothetical protein
VAGDTVPQVAPLHPIPESAQLTPLLPESLATVAENVWGVPTCTVAAGKDIVTEIAPGGGVVPPPPLGLTVPVQPESSARVNSVTTATERGGSPVQDRFTVESPNYSYCFFFLEPERSGGWSGSLFSLHDTYTPGVVNLCGGMTRVTVPYESAKSTAKAAQIVQFLAGKMVRRKDGERRHEPGSPWSRRAAQEWLRQAWMPWA